MIIFLSKGIEWLTEPVWNSSVLFIYLSEQYFVALPKQLSDSIAIFLATQLQIATEYQKLAHSNTNLPVRDTNQKQRPPNSYPQKKPNSCLKRLELHQWLYKG